MRIIKAIVILYIPLFVDSICYCPVESTDIRYDKHYDRRLCDDNEAGKECNAANNEVTDMVNSIGRNADLFLESQVIVNKILPITASYLRTKLSFALEKEKPVADCEDGLATNIKVKGTSTWCFSEKLLNECQRINKSISDYSTNISVILQYEILNDKNNINFGVANGTELTIETVNYIKSIENRGAILTGKIRCAAYESTIEDITNNSNNLYTNNYLNFSIILVFLTILFN